MKHKSNIWSTESSVMIYVRILQPLKSENKGLIFSEVLFYWKGFQYFTINFLGMFDLYFNGNFIL